MHAFSWSELHFWATVCHLTWLLFSLDQSLKLGKLFVALVLTILTIMSWSTQRWIPLNKQFWSIHFPSLFLRAQYIGIIRTVPTESIWKFSCIIPQGIRLHNVNHSLGDVNCFLIQKSFVHYCTDSRVLISHV